MFSEMSSVIASVTRGWRSATSATSGVANTREVEIGSPIRTRPPGSASKSLSSRTVASCRFTISRARSTKIWPDSVSRTPRLPRSSSREP